MTDEAVERTALLELTTNIVAAHVSNNYVPIAEVGTTIESVFAAFSELQAPSEPPEAPLVPAVPIKKSVTDEHIICLEDGKQLKML